MQVAFIPLGLVYTQVLLISHGTHSVKLPFFQKGAIVVMNVNMYICDELGGAYAQD